MSTNKEEQILNQKTALSGADIDRISEELESELINKNKCQPKEAKRICLTAEEIMLNIRGKAGENCEAEVALKKRFGKSSIQLRFRGEPFDPRMDSGEMSALLTMYDLIPDYHFKNGYNIVSVPVTKKKKAAWLGIVIALAVSLLVILFSELFPALPVKAFLASSASPLFETMIGFITAISGPIIFLSVLSGILAIGDISTLKSAGLRIIRDTLIISSLTVAAVLAAASAVFDMQIVSAENSVNDGSAIVQMILDIIPDNFFSPFITGNSLQIIFLAMIFGAVILALSTKIKVVGDMVFELQDIFQQLMIWVNGLMPFLVCVTVLHIYVSGESDIVFNSLNTVLLVIAASLLLMLLMILFLSIKYKTSFANIVKKMLPSFILSVSTGSSSAVYLTNHQTCCEKFGVERSLADFGIPFGQVVCMPGVAAIMSSVVAYLAVFYQVEITVTWLITAVIGIVLVSVAAPPIPGGGIAVYSVILTLLGIPAEGLAVAVPIEMIMEYLATGVNIMSGQFVLIRTADKLKKLDLTTFRSSK